MDILDVLAVILGVLYTMRKVRVRRVESDDYPHIPREQFDAWQQKELGAYTLGSTACFLKIFVDIAVRVYHSHYPLGPNVLFVVGFGIFIAWVGALLATALIGRAARIRRDQLGIELRPARTQAPEH